MDIHDYMKIPFNIIFLCTGNSCRSQMAEGWARKYGGSLFEVQSAGIEAHGKNPRAIAVMKESGIDIAPQRSTKLTSEMLSWADLVVTVCDHADSRCPVMEPEVEKEHWSLQDPAKARGSEEQIMDQFRASRDDIEARVYDLLERLKNINRC